MATIVSSTYTVGHPQQDGRRFIEERHLLDDGRSVDFEYLADDQINPGAVMAERAARLSAELQAQEASSSEAATEVRLDDPATISAVQMYEGFGLIAQGRAGEILNG